MNELMSDEAGYRTAPATPGLLKIMTRFNLGGTPKLRQWKKIFKLTGGYDYFHFNFSTVLIVTGSSKP